ncbi:MAG: (2Fe-2S)-binding protein [Gemmatimonadota bacterium]
MPTTFLNVSLSVNGTGYTVSIDSRATLLEVLRGELGLTGTKPGCEHGECGACTVLVNGRRVLSCLALAATQEGAEVTTIEGLAPLGALHPVQQAFIDHDAMQCGFCTPGQVLSAVACLAEGHASSREEIREWMSGNLCRCSAYPQIVDAVFAAGRAIVEGA